MSMSCGKHVVNHILQRNAYSDAQFWELVPESARELREDPALHGDVSSRGNFSIEHVGRILRRHGLDLKMVARPVALHEVRELLKPPCVAIMVGSGTHYTVVIRTPQEARSEYGMVKLDSMRSPVAVVFCKISLLPEGDRVFQVLPEETCPRFEEAETRARHIYNTDWQGIHNARPVAEPPTKQKETVMASQNYKEVMGPGTHSCASTLSLAGRCECDLQGGLSGRKRTPSADHELLYNERWI